MRSYSLARILGFLGGLLVLLGSVLTFFFGVLSAAVERSLQEGLGSWALSIEQFVIGLVLLFFVALAGSRPVDYRLAGGAVLIVLSLVALLLFGGGVLIVVGLILTLIAGILFVVPNR